MTANSDGNDMQTLQDRERFIKEDLLPKIPKMRRYLGNVDFSTEFYARKGHGQSNWEFDDRDTKTTFKAQLIGEIADATHGTNLKSKGNFKLPNSDPTLQLNDKSNVKNIIVLCRLAGSNVKAEKAFLNQTVPLNNIYEHVSKADKRNEQKPTNGDRNNWLDTSAATDADSHPSDLIIINLLKKFDTPKATSSNPKGIRVTERVPLMDEDDDKAAHTVAKTVTKQSDEGQDQNVVVGGFYEPSLLPDYSPVVFGLIKNKLVQHDVTDINDQLIPAWKLEEGLRPGSVILVSATLHVYNINNRDGVGFRRYYQINAERIKVLAKPLVCDEEEHSKITNAPDVDDFALFSSKKRKDEEGPDDHSSKKNKTEIERKDSDDFEMIQDN